MNFSTKNSDFSILKNGIDPNLEIIRHDETGYYNITKIANLINRISAENDMAGIPPTSDYRSKRIKNWLANESTKKLVRVCKRYVDFDDFDEVVYELKSNTPKKYTGTYVHRYLYDQFLNWLDVEYAIRISRLLDDIHQEANKKVVKEKDDKIDELKQMIKDIEAKASRERREILGEIKEARDDIDDLHNTVITQHQTAIDIAQHAAPQVKASKQQYFAMTVYQRIGDTSGTLYFRNWRLQACKINSELLKSMTVPTKKKGIEFTVHQLVIPPMYTPGPVCVGVAGSDKVRCYLKNKLANLNRGARRQNKTKLKEFFNEVGIEFSTVNPVWKPNQFVSRSKFIDFFLNEIKDTKARPFELAAIQKKIDEQCVEQHRLLINSTGEARERLEGLAEIISRARETIDATSISEDDLTNIE